MLRNLCLAPVFFSVLVSISIAQQSPKSMVNPKSLGGGSFSNAISARLTTMFASWLATPTMPFRSPMRRSLCIEQ